MQNGVKPAEPQGCGSPAAYFLEALPPEGKMAR
jgi:hypothetical protein